MVQVPSPIPNETFRKKIYAGTEAVPGTAVTPEFKLYGDLIIDRERPLAENDTYAGTYDADYTPSYGPISISGSYSQPLTFEDLCMLPRYAVAGDTASTTGATDSQSPPGYTYTYDPTPAANDLDAMTLLYNFDGILFQSTGVRFDEFTISADVDNANAGWMWASRIFAKDKVLVLAVDETAVTSGAATTLTKTGAAWTVNTFVGQYVEIISGVGMGQDREIISNTADTLTVAAWDTAPTSASTFSISSEFTAGVLDRTRETINGPGTLLWIDDVGVALGTRIVDNQFISFSVTMQNNIVPKRFMENTTGYSAKIGRGRRRVTAQLRLEFDHWREYMRWEDTAVRRVRIKQTGTDIATGFPRLAQIDLPNLRWETHREDARGNNITATMTGRGYVDATALYSMQLLAKSALAVLPGE